MMIDHSKENNIEGLFTLIGVRATIARKDAKKSIDIISERLNKKTGSSKTSKTPIYGGHIENFKELCLQAERFSQQEFGCGVKQPLIHNYGSKYREVLKYVGEDSSFGQEIDVTGVIRAEVIHAVREEMAVKLQDVLFRRTELGTGENPGRRAIEISAELMAGELAWSQQKTADEIEEVSDIFMSKGPWQLE